MIITQYNEEINIVCCIITINHKLSINKQYSNQMSQYGRAQYWQQRYSRDPQPFDWYQRYFALRDLLGESVPVDFRILNVGAGNSRLSEQMFDDGYDSITNIDISQSSIKIMNEKYKQKGANFNIFKWMCGAMEFPENSFDAVIDKGTFDSVLCGQGSNTNANKMLSEVYRVLGPNGVYVMISYAPKQSRLNYLEKQEFNWGVVCHQLAKPTVTATITPADPNNPAKNNHYLYICTKGKKNEGQAEQKKQEKQPQ